VSAAFTGHRAGIRTMPVTRPSPALVPAGGHCHTVRQGARFKFATSAWLLLAGAFRRLLLEQRHWQSVRMRPMMRVPRHQTFESTGKSVNSVPFLNMGPVRTKIGLPAPKLGGPNLTRAGRTTRGFDVVR
jgi:hypothetical protein